MVDQIIYDNSGAFQCVIRANPNGSQTSFGPGSNLWDDYIAKNGTPPATGTPTFPPAPIPANVQTAMTALKNYFAGTANPTQDQINKALIVVLRYFAIQALN